MKHVRQSGRTTKLLARAAEACERCPRVVVIFATKAELSFWRLRADPRLTLMTLHEFESGLKKHEVWRDYASKPNEEIFIDHHAAEHSGELAAGRQLAQLEEL